jgi:hypothetical protein
MKLVPDLNIPLKNSLATLHRRLQFKVCSVSKEELQWVNGNIRHAFGTISGICCDLSFMWVLFLACSLMGLSTEVHVKNWYEELVFLTLDGLNDLWQVLNLSVIFTSLNNKFHSGGPNSPTSNDTALYDVLWHGTPQKVIWKQKHSENTGP